MKKDVGDNRIIYFLIIFVICSGIYGLFPMNIVLWTDRDVFKAHENRAILQNIYVAAEKYAERYGTFPNDISLLERDANRIVWCENTKQDAYGNKLIYKIEKDKMIFFPEKNNLNKEANKKSDWLYEFVIHREGEKILVEKIFKKLSAEGEYQITDDGIQ